LVISRNEEDDLSDPNYKNNRSCNKFGEKIALWSTTIGDGSNFVGKRHMLRKLATIEGD
jgi:hypothetical protein